MRRTTLLIVTTLLLAMTYACTGNLQIDSGPTNALFFDNFKRIVGPEQELYFDKWKSKWGTIEGLTKYFNKISDLSIENGDSS